MKYTVRITETLVKEVEIEAESPVKAIVEAKRQYSTFEIVLDYSDFSHVDIECLTDQMKEKEEERS